MINFSKKILIIMVLAEFILPAPYFVYAQGNQQNNGSTVDSALGIAQTIGDSIPLVPIGSMIRAIRAAKAVHEGNFLGSDLIKRGVGISGIYASIGSFALSSTAYLFNESISLSVVKFSKLYRDNSDTIGAAWRIGRDLANFCFIFILLYIAISTILDRVDWKKLLARVMIIALLVNFSAVIPKIMIDASNILALTFYDNIGNQNSNQTHDLAKAFTVNSGFGPGEKNIFYGIVESFRNVLSGDFGLFNLNNWLDGTIMFILAYILLIGAILFIIRVAVLIMLIVLSPLAFIGWVIPSAGSYTNQWWQRLLGESIFAPAFMFLLYASIKIIENNKFNDSINELVDGTVSKVIYFFIVVVFLTTTITVARKFSSTGAGIAIGWADKVKKLAFGGVALGAGAAGAYTLGKAARAAIKSDTFQNFAARNPFVGNLAQAGLSSVAKKKFAGATSYEDRVEKTASRIEDFKTPERKYNYLTSLGEVDRKAAYGKLTDRQKAELHEYNEDQLNSAIIPGATPAQIDQARKIHKTVNDLGPKVGTEPYEKMETERKKIRDNKNVKEALTLINPPAPATGGPPPAPTPANVQTALNTLKGKNINKLEPSVLTSPNVAANLNSSHLAAIKDHPDITPADRDKIRMEIERAVNPRLRGATVVPTTGTPEQQKAYKWLEGPGGQDF